MFFTKSCTKICYFFRRQRMVEMKEASMRAKYGSVKEISKVDYVTEVNQAGEGVWVVLHVYKNE